MQWCEVSSKSIAVLRVAVLSLSLTLPLQSAAASSSNSTSKPLALSDWCAALATRLPKVTESECLASKLQASGISSFNGFPILTKDVAADPRYKQALRVLLLGGIHGDEQTASSVVFKWLQLQGKSNTQEFQWKVAPVINPDGLLAVKPKRVNARGVDLNRNFPTPNWQQDAPKYWANTTRSDPRRYPGKQPISEPESRWVYDTIEKFKPDVIISVHAPFGVLDLDGPAKPPKSFGRLWYNRVGVYPGSLGNYSGMHKNIPVVTIELPNALRMPPDAEVQRIWLDMQSWIRRNVPAAQKARQKL